MAPDGSLPERASEARRPRPRALEVFRDAAPAAHPTPEMIALPVGAFQMGSPDADDWGHAVERPRRVVRFDRSLAMGRYAVTFEEYDAFAQDAGVARPGDHGWGRGRRPVVNVGWHDAVAYCAWLSERTGAPYRLPSEAEWEYACRAGIDARFSTGDAISTDQANFNGEGDGGVFLQKTVEVGAFPPNAWGLHEMHGNVAEWVQDCWIEGYDGAPADGAPRHMGETEHAISAVVRGGGWSARSRFVRAADRWHYGRDVAFEFIGFRVARDL
ncbi:MAG: formylglycine-generating enzyme family protein [Pseudomonadota bacterium]